MRQMQKWLTAVMTMFLTLSFAACSDDGKKDDEPDNIPAIDIAGIWRQTNYDIPYFIQLNEDNSATFIETGTVADNKTEAHCIDRYYTYDAENKFLIIHYNYNDDADIYKVTELSDSQLRYIWIEDISELYRSSKYNKYTDLSICEDFANKNLNLDYGDEEQYKKSNKKELQDILDECDYIYYH